MINERIVYGYLYTDYPKIYIILWVCINDIYLYINILNVL